MKVVVANAGPRIGWNTDTLLKEASKGVESNGVIIERFDLFKLEKYTGCISCFACKKEAYKGHCICRDGLTKVLDAIRESDGLIIGSPNYLFNVTASFRALFERLIFQYLTYNAENPCCNDKRIPVLLIMTSNSPENISKSIMEQYKQTFDSFIGDTSVFISGDTLQLKDYTKTDWEWSYFNAVDKIKRHDTIFPEECKKVHDLAKSMFK